jgi:hypothetical protein
MRVVAPLGAAQQLAAADPAGVRRVGDALPAEMRENEWTVACAAGQLPLASSGCCAKLEAVRRAQYALCGSAVPSTAFASCPET